MSTEQVQKCDVYGTRKEVWTYLVCLEIGGEDENISLLETTVDLGPRGLRRLEAAIQKGIAPTAEMAIQPSTHTSIDWEAVSAPLRKEKWQSAPAARETSAGTM